MKKIGFNIILKWYRAHILSMKKELSVIGIALSILMLVVTTSSVTAQNATTNASNAMNKTGEAANATVNELGKNASNASSSLLNQTAEVGKKIVGGAATVLGNISGEIKEGVGAK
jgi:uncharacterized membrane protein YeiB